MGRIFIIAVTLMALLVVFVAPNQAQPVAVDELAMDSLDTVGVIEGGNWFVLSTEPKGDGKICPHLGLLSGRLFDLQTQNTSTRNDETLIGIRLLIRRSIFAANIGLDPNMYNAKKPRPY